ncbi:MAG: DUF7130 family rubredoxin-like protein [Halobacteriota archaeon]
MVGERHLRIGEGVYTEGGDHIGTIVAVGEDGVRIKLHDSKEGERDPGYDERPLGYGEVELQWRCSTCGEVGPIEQLPEVCPGCGASKEELYYRTED